MTLALSQVLIVQAPALAAHVPAVPMGTLTGFSAVAHTTITDTGSTSTFADGVAVSPGTDITTIADIQVLSGGIHRNDSVAQQAQTDLTAAYQYASTQTGVPIGAALGGQTLFEGVHSSGATALGLTGTLTLDGGGNKGSVFIIQTTGAFTAAAAAEVVLTNGAQECNVFWQVQGAVTLGAGATFRGTLLANGAVTVGAGADFYGRAFTTQGDMTLSGNTFYEPTCGGVTVAPSASPLVTTEAGGSATFTVVLNTQPTADVTIGVSSDDLSEGSVSTGLLTFTTSNWATAQTVTVTGVDDFLVDGTVAYTVVLAAASGGDYAGTDPADVEVTNTDNDAVGVTVAPSASPLVTTEAGGSATFTVVLNTQPTADVTIGVSSSDTTEGTASVLSLVFTAQNWATPQTVTVTGVNESVDDGDVAYSVVLAPATGGDYAGINPADVSATNTDNEPLGITVAPTSGLVTTEVGGTATFTVVLDAQPSADVTIGVSSSDTTEGTASVLSLVFTAQNWATPQTVTVTGVNDSVDDGDVTYSVVLALATGGDYAGINPADVSATNTDDDSVGVTVTPAASPLVTSEAGGSATFTVVLNSEPTVSVTIGVSSSDLGEGTVSTASLTFTTVNWSVAQTVAVTGVNDSVDDGDVAYTVVLAAASGGDYAGFDPADVSATNADDDVAVGGGSPAAVLPPVGLVDTSSACPASMASSAFTDLAGLDQATIQAIDCLFGYGVSNGTTQVSFAPSGTVTRWQMALFLTRQLRVHGLVLPFAIDQGFADVGGYDQETQDAIDQLAQLGITRGTGGGTFSPDEAVSRWEMALFLVRFLRVAGVPIPTLSATGPFNDLTQLGTETVNAIDQLAALGVAAGTSTTTFDPSTAVLRWQMALFLTRVLALDGVVPS